MGTWGRRTFTTTAASVSLLALSTTSALAHHCYNDARSDTGNQKAAGSEAMVTVAEFIDMTGEFGVCEAGIDHLQAWAQEEGISEKLVHMRATMAGGAEGKYRGNGIAFLSEDALQDAFELCGPPPGE